jgi:flavin reductase (DIM6/NTAB) family NADH-FMN oxidoreductase RutF
VPVDDFTRIVGELDYPMYIVTTVADGVRSGCLVGFATQCSIDPPRYAVFLSDKNHTARVAAGAQALAVHVPPGDELELARLFGGETGDDVDKFARCAWHPGPEGLPILDACDRWFAGRILDRARSGDHIAYVIEVFAAHAPARPDAGGGEPLRFQQVRSLDPGHDA